MAEHRAIKSAIWDDTWFGRLSPFEMAVWIGLFSKCADDQGRLQDDAALIRSKLFPYQDIAISSIEGALDTFAGHIIRYQKGEHLAQLVRWFDNQPMQYAVPSNFPPPDDWIDRYRTTYKKTVIVWNWGQMENTPAGVLLWSGLRESQRPSSWTTYLARLNPNPNPNPIPNPKKEDTQGARQFSESAVADKLILEITGWVALPRSEENLEFMRDVPTIIQRQKDTKNYLTPFWKTYDKRYPGSTRLAWIGWALTGKIPSERKPQRVNGRLIPEPVQIEEWTGRNER